MRRIYDITEILRLVSSFLFFSSSTYKANMSPDRAIRFRLLFVEARDNWHLVTSVKG